MLDQAQALRNLVENKNKEVNSKNDSEKKQCKVITVTSGKGGVGKSNFVVNLGITLQKSGKNVLIFDADVGMGNDDILMGFLPKYNIYDIILKEMKIEEVIITGPYGIKLLPAGSGLNKLEEIDEEQRKNFFEKLSLLEEIDYILMDTGAGISRSVLGFISCSDEMVIVTTPEPTAITDAYSLMKAVTHFNVKKNSKIVINKVLEKKEGEITFNKLCNVAKRFLNMELEYLGSIREDRKLIQAVREQKPFVINYPNCEASQDIKNIALNISKNKFKLTSNNKVKGLFEKIFKIFG